jgi:hypothetical protein
MERGQKIDTLVTPFRQLNQPEEATARPSHLLYLLEAG